MPFVTGGKCNGKTRQNERKAGVIFTFSRSLDEVRQWEKGREQSIAR